MELFQKIWLIGFAVFMLIVVVLKVWIYFIKYKRAKFIMEKGAQDINERMAQYLQKYPENDNRDIKKLRLDYYHYIQSQKQAQKKDS